MSELFVFGISILNIVRLGNMALVHLLLPHAVEECARQLPRIDQLRLGLFKFDLRKFAVFP